MAGQGEAGFGMTGQGWVGSGMDMENLDWVSRQKVPDQKEGTPNHPGERLVVMKVCFRVVPD